MLQQVGDHQTHRARDSCQAVHQNVGLLEGRLDPLRSLVEIFRQVESIAVLTRNIEVVRDVRLRVVEEYSFGRGQDSAD